MDSDTKVQWRARLRSRRLAMDDDAGHLRSHALASAGLLWVQNISNHAPVATICAYISVGKEPPTAELLLTLVRSGHRVFVPVCESDYQLSWVQWTPGVEMIASRFAPVVEPAGTRHLFDELGSVDGILLPALALDTSGIRLGQGGGYYDRFLASIMASGQGEGPAVPTSGVVYEHEVLQPLQLPHDSLDQPVNFLLTPAGYRKAMK